MTQKSIMQEYHDMALAIQLIKLGARIQMLESETSLSRGKLIKLYKELQGTPPPKGLLPFSTTWFMTWEPNIHSSVFFNAYQFLINNGIHQSIQAMIKAYQLYLEQCPPAEGKEAVLGLTRAWILVKFVESKVMQQSCCKACLGLFITHAYQPQSSFTCSLCQPPSRVEKNHKTIKTKDSEVKFLQALSSVCYGLNA